MAINILSPVVANQIAAGEVVNRPSSVVKELMENAIDAGATNISLVIQDAGRQLIEVVDNGCGMDEEDCKKCFLAHATSKINTAEDLHNLSTMGFRGEALASIAAIAQVELRSKQEGQELGTEVVIEGGEIKQVEAATCKQGTDIKVKNIFFNVPARRNFLKSDNVENSHISDEFLRIAIIHNDISFSYYNNGKIIYRLDKTNPKKRISDIFGDTFNRNLLTVEESVDVVKISGFISTVSLTRKSKNEQYFFVNKRFMKNSYLANAVERVYQGMIPDKTFPIFFLSLTVDPKNIDVNIHPTKTEIKFLDDKLIYSVLYATVRKALGQNTLSTQLDFEKKDIVFPATTSKQNVYQPKISYNSSYNPFSSSMSNTNFDNAGTIETPVAQTEITFSRDAIIEETKHNSFDSFQFLNKYIVTRMQDSILYIDQHRASKQIIYHKLNNKQTIEVNTQRLILPLNHKFAIEDNFKILEKIDYLKTLGFEMSYKEDSSFDITAIPYSISNEKAVEMIEDIVSADNIEVEQEEKRQKLNLSIAEKLAIKSGKVLNKEEIMQLIAELFKIPIPETLPNGEKVILKVDSDFLQRSF